MRVLHLYTGHAQANSRSDPHPSAFLSVRSSYNVLLDKPLQFGPCVKATLSLELLSCFLFILRTDGKKCWRSHEGEFGRRPVREAGKGSGCFLDAAGHSQRVCAKRGGHWQVGELGVKVSQVCGTRH